MQVITYKKANAFGSQVNRQNVGLSDNLRFITHLLDGYAFSLSQKTAITATMKGVKYILPECEMTDMVIEALEVAKAIRLEIAHTL
jgi:hypothetical protein